MTETNQIHEFAHEAMDTEFKLSIAGVNAKYARQASVTVFREIDNIETLLSRYIEHSDISRINNLPNGGTTIIDPTTFKCLEKAIEICRETKGVFDVAYASKPSSPLKELFTLNHSKCSCRVLDSGLQIDLGGIGKGFALDEVADLLLDWDIDRVLLQASHSTILARKPPPDKKGWELGFGSVNNRQQLNLNQQAISGSGIAVKGEHIIDNSGRSGKIKYRAWSLATSGARADALSTAFMLMKTEQIRDYLSAHPSEKAWVQKKRNSAIEQILPKRL